VRIFLHSRAFLPNLGGVEQVSSMLARGLTARGHKVIVATDVEADPEFDRGLAYEVQRKRSVTEMARVARGCDLVHASGASLVSAEVAMLARRPLVTTHHGYQPSCLEGLGWHAGDRCSYQLPRCFELTRKHGGSARAVRQLARYPLGRAQLHLARANIAVSKFVGSIVAAPRTRVVYNCADTSVFKPGDPSSSRTHLLFLGRFVGEKGVDLLLRAVGRAKDDGDRLMLDLVGSGPLEGAYRLLVKELGIEPQVRFRGPLRGEPLADAIRSSIAVVVPSTWDEAFGIVAAEALSCGRAALVSDRGGLPEVVESMETVVPGSDPETWAKALVRVTQDGGWREEQEGKAALAAARFTPERFLEGYLSVYREALHERA
jgi:glycosyltransferase involved in cell wall biosynthesis